MEAIKLIEKKCHNKHDIEFLSLHLYRVQVQARSKIENNGGNLSNYFLNTQYITFVFCWVENVVEKDKCWLPDFFFTGFFSHRSQKSSMCGKRLKRTLPTM